MRTASTLAEILALIEEQEKQPRLIVLTDPRRILELLERTSFERDADVAGSGTFVGLKSVFAEGEEA